MKYKLPKLNAFRPLTIEEKMSIYCDMAGELIRENSGCKGITCEECLFFQGEITPEQEKQFLEWEKTIKEKQ